MENLGVIPYIILNDGHKMPVIGLGTATSPLGGSESTKHAVLHAIKLGYRHFDTASLYLTEESVGEAIAEALALGLIKSREELFITTKLWCSDTHPDLVIPALQKSLRVLQLEYVDLYLIHWPVSSTPGVYEFPIERENFIKMDIVSVWGAMEESKNIGLTKSIGISNFSSKKLEEILNFSTIPPSVNQVEMNPIWQQKSLRPFCKQRGVMLTAYAPLGAKGTVWGSNEVLENATLQQIATAKNKTVAQICLRWAFEQGVCIVVKSFNEQRMKENIEIFNWALTEEENQQISKIPQSRICTGEDYISHTGPYKTLEELWDGDM